MSKIVTVKLRRLFVKQQVFKICPQQEAHKAGIVDFFFKK
jgi:hypothetical protein